ncbi:hypothetical protein AGMMS50212_03090 [Spirochaetia bacterium]|nr:hypothetical protein AGMMS50212_03090 [Spirochaetia bacterium]
MLLFAGEFSVKKYFYRNGYNYVNADLFDKSADLKIDIQNMPFKDETWSLICCNHVLEHVVDYEATLRECRRVLKKMEFLN